jgi:hypothetical protein
MKTSTEIHFHQISAIAMNINSYNISSHIDKHSERYLSTTVLAKKLGISKKTLFLRLAQLGFIKKMISINRH